MCNSPRLDTNIESLRQSRCMRAGVPKSVIMATGQMENRGDVPSLCNRE